MGRIRKEWMRKRRVMVKTICSRRVISREVGDGEGGGCWRRGKERGNDGRRRVWFREIDGVVLENTYTHNWIDDSLVSLR
jgi:hypothetical protein